MSYKGKTLFEKTDEETDEYFNSPEGQIMLGSMFKKMEEMQEKNSKKEK